MKMKKILMKYREIARYVNPEIKIQKDNEWLSYVDLKTIGVPQIVTEQGEREFLASIKKQLPNDKKDLINIIPDFMWILKLIRKFVSKMNWVAQLDIKIIMRHQKNANI